MTIRSHLRQFLARITAVAWLLALVVQSKAQAENAYKLSWITQFGDAAYCRPDGIAADSAGNVHVCGWAGGISGGGESKGSDGFLRKYDAEGKLLWTRQFDLSAEDDSSAVSTDGEGNVFVAGHTATISVDDGVAVYRSFLTKFNARGNVIWTRQSPATANVQFRAVSADAMGNVYVAAFSLATPDGTGEPGPPEGFLQKWDTDGQSVWTRPLAARHVLDKFGVSSDGLGDVFVVGTQRENPGTADSVDPCAFLAKYSAAGTLLWRKESELPDPTYAYAVSADRKGSVFTCGTITGISEDGQEPMAAGQRAGAYVSKYDGEGRLAFTRLLRSNWSHAMSLSADGRGNVYLASRTTDPLDGQNLCGITAVVCKFDGNGRRLWTHVIGADDTTSARCVVADSSGHVYAAGATLESLFDANLHGREAFVIRLVPATGSATWLLAGGSIVLLLGLRFLIASFR